VTKLFQSLIEGVPRERFRCTLFHCDDRRDGITEALARSADEYLGGERSARDWAELIAASGMDALVYVDIGMHPIPQFLSAYRLAPLQCALWGHPVTTGSRHIDLFLSADAMEPDDGERNYSERLIRLPRLGTCYRYPDVSPAAGLEIPGAAIPARCITCWPRTWSSSHPCTTGCSPRSRAPCLRRASV
jgi:predicted O-linked N-acetylglucosamine transferase (SPINDLY family)